MKKKEHEAYLQDRQLSGRETERVSVLWEMEGRSLWDAGLGWALVG